jgi:plastocyanin
VAGRIEITNSTGEQQPAANAVVWLPGIPGEAGAAPRMASKNKRFAPHVQVVRRGGSIVFPNLDRIYHNVFSTTAGQGFDLGLYRNGATRERRFEKAGVVTVYCNIHPQMVGFVRVVDGVWALTDENGAFRIAGVPPGRHRVRVWHEKGGERDVTTTVRSLQRAEVRLLLDASRYRLQPHKNKHGQDYPPATLDDDRY